ncbi:MAG: hypothetical protein JRN26_04380 [Nitrososphaerota archaeon]|jgi:hypothetical protein|nr:hypothetical protein [Nitrososphaerota archaeon]MDG6932528.1 hypothetical protein [Nitrososphaerota archaeon]MDG6936101.1 hypothetical protein [Nitrososphaerota archaeon]MDG6944537.1 hypothetical protein [Nitrososphaerota archaeon]
MTEYTNITVKKETKVKLEMLGHKGETWDELINRLAVAGSAKGENRSFNDTEKTAIDGITQVEAQ